MKDQVLVARRLFVPAISLPALRIQIWNKTGGQVALIILLFCGISVLDPQRARCANNAETVYPITVPCPCFEPMFVHFM